jgi:hypothetical protein
MESAMSDLALGVAVVEAAPGGPAPPAITNKDIWAQFKIDIAGKEVQTAETYSHSWIANQFGHVCLGIILGAILAVAAGDGISTVFAWFRLPFRLNLPFPWDVVTGSVIAAIVFCLWEWRAYKSAMKNANGQFPPDRKLLRDNAVTAAAYMVLGVLIAAVYRCFGLTSGNWFGVPTLAWGVFFFVGIVVAGILLAVPWLRQKIVWQKAGLPYLFRIAEAPPTMEDEDARKLYEVITKTPPPEMAPMPIVIGGPIGSGRTELCAGIGTEFAFKSSTVRYLSFATLLEFAARSQNPDFFDESGPANIAYWAWSKAQVVIIDDIGPVLAPAAGGAYAAYLRQVLNDCLATVRAVLARCHTIWVIGDPWGDGRISSEDRALDELADVIRDFCTVEGKPPKLLVVQLDHGAPERTIKRPRGRTHYLG